MNENPKPDAYLVKVHPRVAGALLHGPGESIAHLESETGKAIFFEGGEGLPLDHFEISFEGTRKKVEERALPFQIGDEVMVTVVEPHMYEEDAAVAKLDHYIISIAGAMDRIGTKALVRIADVERNLARAVIADDGPPKSAKKSTAKAAPKAATQKDDDDAVESPSSRGPRRRGSRGGRGRSRAKSPGSDAGDNGNSAQSSNSEPSEGAPAKDSSASSESTP